MIQRIRNWIRHERAFRLLSQAIEFDKQGNQNKANEVHEKLVDSYPEFDAGITSYAIFLYNHGSKDAAMHMLREAAQIGNQNSEILNLLGRFLMAEGRNDEAVIVFQEAISKNPEDLESLKWLANLSSRTGQDGLAEEAFIATTRILHDDAHNWEKFGDFLHAKQRDEEALHAYQQSIKFNPRAYSVWVKLGVILLNENRIDESINAFDKAVEIEPTTDYGIITLGERLEKLGVIDLSEKKEVLNCLDRRARMMITISLSGLGSMPDAERKYRDLVERSPEYAGFWHTLGQCLIAQSKYTEAESVLRKAVQVNSKLSPAWCDLGIALLKQNRIQEARDAVNRAVELDPNNQKSTQLQKMLL